MGERFVVVPVDRGVAEHHSDAVVSDPAPAAPGTPAPDSPEERVSAAGEDSVFEPQEDPDAVVPILEYNREPNKYGKDSLTNSWLSHFLSPL